ncbi:MAG: response regulator [Elusimicrobiota bacterium]
MTDKKDPKTCLILIVDDDSTVVDFFSTTMEIEGFTTEIAFDGGEALASMRKSKPSLILLDLMLPTKGGYEVLREMQSDKELKDIPVIVITAKSLEAESKKFLAEGVNILEIIEKPINPTILAHKVHKALNTLTMEDKIIERGKKQLEQLNIKPEQLKKKLWDY